MRTRTPRGNLRPAGVRLISFAGSNGVGSCVDTSLRAGDVILSIVSLASAPYAHAETSFEAVVSVGGKLRQISAANLSAVNYLGTVIGKAG